MTRTLDAAASAGDEHPDDSRAHRRFLGLLFVAAVGAMWLIPFGSSLWLDEAITVWVVEEGPATTVQRALDYQSGGVPYFLLADAIHAIAGVNSVALRLPSLLFLLGSSLLVLRIAERLVDRETGRIAAIAFASQTLVAFAAGDARPHALALSLVLSCTWLVIRWLDDGRWTHAVGAGLLAALVPYTQYVWTFALIVPATYAFSRLRAGSAARGSQAIALLIGVPLLAAPLIPHFLDVRARADVLSAPGDASVRRLAAILLPPVIVLGAVLGAAIARRVTRSGFTPPRIDRQGLTLILVGATSQPLILFLISRASDTKILFDRYFLASAPFLAILIAIALRGLDGKRARRIAAATLTGVALLAGTRTVHLRENWRSTADIVRALDPSPTTPILVESGLIESKHLSWLDAGGERRSYLLSPLAPYPVPGRLLPLPFSLTNDTEDYLDRLAAEILFEQDRFIVVLREFRGFQFLGWLDGRFEAGGYERRYVDEAGSLGVMEYRRVRASSEPS